MTPISAARKRPLKRKRATREPRPRVLILCEGSKTEPSYFEHWKRFLRGHLVDIEIGPSARVPKSLVEEAAERKREAAKEARRRRDHNLKYDQVWCVFDIDEHPNIPEAKDQARANGISLAISNPSFELWLVLHSRDQNRYLGRGEALALCERDFAGYSKFVTDSMFATLRARHDNAVQRAERLAANHVSGGGTPSDNPSSGVGDLVDRLRSAFSTAPIVNP